MDAASTGCRRGSVTCRGDSAGSGGLIGDEANKDAESSNKGVVGALAIEVASSDNRLAVL